MTFHRLERSVHLVHMVLIPDHWIHCGRRRASCPEIFLDGLVFVSQRSLSHSWWCDQTLFIYLDSLYSSFLTSHSSWLLPSHDSVFDDRALSAHNSVGIWVFQSQWFSCTSCFTINLPFGASSWLVGGVGFIRTRRPWILAVNLQHILLAHLLWSQEVRMLINLIVDSLSDNRSSILV